MAEPLAKPENKFRTFYHGTYPDRIEGILRTGLDPNYSGQGGGTLPGLNEKDPRSKIFLTTSPAYAEFYAAMAAKTSAMAKAKEEGKGWIRQMLATGTPASPLRIDLPNDFKVNELGKGLYGDDEHYVTDLISPKYIKAMNSLEKTSNDLTVLAPKWSERGHLLAALPKHLTDAQEAIKSQQNIDKEMTDLSLIAGAWLKSQQQKELLETRLKRFKETAGYPSMASVLPIPAVVGSTNKEQATNNLNKAAAFGAMMGKMAADLGLAPVDDAGRRVFLVSGHSGAGKSTVAKSLGETLKLPVLSIDDHPRWRPMLDSDPEIRHTVSGSPERRRFINAARGMATEMLDSAKDGAVVEGTQLSLLGRSQLAKYPNRVLVTTPLQDLLRQRLERAKIKSIAKGNPWNEAIEARKYGIGKKLYDSNYRLINRYGSTPGTVEYNTKNPKDLNKLFKVN